MIVQFDVEKALALYAIRDGKLVDTGERIRLARRAGLDPLDAALAASRPARTPSPADACRGGGRSVVYSTLPTARTAFVIAAASASQ